MKQDKQHENKVSLLDLSYRMSYEAPYKKEQTYIYNTYSGTLDNVLDVCKKLEMPFEVFYPFDYGYLPLDPFCTDGPLIEYLTSLHQKETDLFLKKYRGEEGIEGIFCTMFEFSIFRSGWNSHLFELRLKKALEWCKQYGIQYTTDIPLYNKDGTIARWLKLNSATQEDIDQMINQSAQNNQGTVRNH